ncbi:integumentary mucin C.1-like isoform X1 [Ictalurus furcatus]|uniref:integumentary mucin C.1-like isoform X1 n=1 Tax=Ictalurus furcatus TaxID=66913 RepID=UPI00234FE00B|nr:integumentary mucin C.1-like isoform X1 [Ictalurus furcatus]
MSDKYNMTHFFTTTTTTTTTTTITTTTTTTSDKYNMTRFFPTPTQPSITAEKSTAYSSSESTPQSITTQKSTAGSLPTVLSVTGVCVLLAGLMSFCLCVCSNGDEVYTEVMYTLSSQQFSEETQLLSASSE